MEHCDFNIGYGECKSLGLASTAPQGRSDGERPWEDGDFIVKDHDADGS